MHTVPSLIGTGTATAAAASGLVFGQSDNPPFTNRRALRNQDQLTPPDNGHGDHLNLPTSRPGTGSRTSVAGEEQTSPRNRTKSRSRPPLSRYQRPQSSQFTAMKPTHSAWRPGEDQVEPATYAEDSSRNSISSASSWIRRLSIRPLSQHGSARSSVIYDYQSATFSHGSAAPILRPKTAAAQLAPNKLVKRSSSTQAQEPGVVRAKSRSHLPTLRRPATSHQRSATLQQFQRGQDDSFDLPTDQQMQNSRPTYTAISSTDAIAGRMHEPESSSWTSFFHSRTSDVPNSAPAADGIFDDPGVVMRRIEIRSTRPQAAHLVKPDLVLKSRGNTLERTREINEKLLTDVPREKENINAGKDDQTLKDPSSSKMKRSLSSSFASAGNWVTKTSGSLRRPKREIGAVSGGAKRHVSAPITASQTPAGHATTARIPANSCEPPLEPAHLFQQSTHKRTLSSPLPPLNCTSSSQTISSRAGFSGGVYAHNPRPNQPSGSSASSAAMSQPRAPEHDREIVAESLDSEGRGNISGEDDDTDFKSDTLYDSFRTAASSRMRAVETPLESVYDESPPSTAENEKLNGAVRDMISHVQQNDGIIEEDENMRTPMRVTQTVTTHHDVTRELLRLELKSPQRFSTGHRDALRQSMESDTDDDWAREDEFILDADSHFSPLSPPSKGSSVNSKAMNPNVRLALASVNGDAVDECLSTECPSERPLSSLFDWSEQPVHDKQNALRPQTAYGKQAIDSRGGRSSLRKGPSPAHIRSQSVPVVHDVAGDPKQSGSKYGTWGLGTKTVSEDWDEDFVFDGGDVEADDKGKDKYFAVPESIQASQYTVKTHSGQIRELSLLVNDLKRLCRHARELNLLHGPQKKLWKEAEGIIALASPDNDLTDEENETTGHIYNQRLASRNSDDDLDVAFAEGSPGRDFSIEQPNMSKTTVVRERQSPRRRSVFSLDDDIFGGSGSGTEDTAPQTPEKRTDVNGAVRRAMEVMQQRTSSEAPLTSTTNRKVQFDTNSLRVLVRRSSELRDALSDIVRKVDQFTESPARASRYERGLDSSPAFTRVFDEPGSSPPRSALRSRGKIVADEKHSPESSPQRQMGRRFPLMTMG